MIEESWMEEHNWTGQRGCTEK
jgi:hypothetical protein